MKNFKNQATVDPHFDKMLSMAEEYFALSKLEKYEYHQCIVLNTVEGEDKIYSFYSDSTKELVGKCCSVLSQEKMPTISKIVCMFEGGFVEVPSGDFMKKLCELNIENKEAEVLLSGYPLQNAYHTKRIVDMIGCFL